MKRVKRIFACLLALTMMFGLSATAFATESGTIPTDQKTVIIKKKYILTNADTTSPEETFTLEQIGAGRVTDGGEVTSVPDLKITGATFRKGAAKTGAGEEGEIKVELPTYKKVGVYEYTLREKAGTTAGVDYYGKDIKLVVTVINGDNGKLRVAAVHTEAAGEGKSDTFENKYSAGKLNISKTVTGNLGDKEKYFEFEVTLEGVDGKTYADSYPVTGSSNKDNPTKIAINNEKTTFKFKLKDNDTIHIELPYGVTYTVKEISADGYTTKVGEEPTNIAEGTMDEKAKTVEFTNTKSGKIDTGVYLDNLPYILVFAGVLAIAAVFVVRRRRFED